MHIYCSDLIWPVNTEKYISLTPNTVFFKIRKGQLTFSAQTTLYGRIIVYSAQRPVVLAPKSLAPVHFEASFKRDWDLDLPEKWCQKVYKHTKWDFFECLLQVFLKFNPPPPQKNYLFGSTTLLAVNLRKIFYSKLVASCFVCSLRWRHKVTGFRCRTAKTTTRQPEI